MPSKSKPAEVTIEAKFPVPLVEVIDDFIKHEVYHSRSEAVVKIVRAHVDHLLEMLAGDEATSSTQRLAFTR